MQHQWTSLLLPDALTPWFAVGAVSAAVLGWQNIARGLAVLPLVNWIVLPLLDPFIDMLPLWVLLVIVPIAALMFLHAVVATLFGREAAGHVVGTYLVRLIDGLLLIPAGTVRLIGRMLVR